MTENDEMKYGVIEGFSHTPGSGLVTMLVMMEEGGPELIHGDDSLMARIEEDFVIGERIGVTYPDPIDGPVIHKLGYE